MANNHFLAESVEGLSVLPPEERTRAWYDSSGDCLHYQTVDEAVIAQWVDPLFTLYRSALDERVIGFQLKDVRALAEKLDAEVEKVFIEAQVDEQGQMRRLNLQLLLLVAFKAVNTETDREQLEAYLEALRQAPEIEPVTMAV